MEACILPDGLNQIVAGPEVCVGMGSVGGNVNRRRTVLVVAKIGILGAIGGVPGVEIRVAHGFG